MFWKFCSGNVLIGYLSELSHPYLHYGNVKTPNPFWAWCLRCRDIHTSNLATWFGEIVSLAVRARGLHVEDIVENLASLLEAWREEARSGEREKEKSVLSHHEVSLTPVHRWSTSIVPTSLSTFVPCHLLTSSLLLVGTLAPLSSWSSANAYCDDVTPVIQPGWPVTKCQWLRSGSAKVPSASRTRYCWNEIFFLLQRAYG